MAMRTERLDYDLPPELIAQQPAHPRDSSRMLVFHRKSGEIEHRSFRDIGEYLQRGDLLVANDSRVIPARLTGRKTTGGKVEIFLLRQLDDRGDLWACLTRGRNLQVGSEIYLERAGGADGGLSATIAALSDGGTRIVRFSAPVRPYLEELGEIPLPPYITAYQGDRERYQTVYSHPEGSAAAPTAGLHFTPELLLSLRDGGVGFERVTLHVGLDTFRPIESELVDAHPIHTEWATLTADTASAVNQTTLQGGRVAAVGTTTARTLEWAATRAQGIEPYDSAACPWQRTAAFEGSVDLFIRPGYRFRAVDVLLTNFHLPRSTLLLMVGAFVAQHEPDQVEEGVARLLEIYQIAIEQRYRFFSFGDAMCIV